MVGDLELLEAWRKGDRAAAGELFDRHAKSLYRFFANKVNEDVEDLVQTTLLACVTGRDRLRDPAQFRAYLFGAARNVLRTRLHERGRPGGALDLENSSIRDLGLGPSSLLAQHQEHRLLLEALRSLPVESQVLLELRYWEDLSTEDLALVFGVASGTIKSRLHRSRARLEEAIVNLRRAHDLVETRTDLEAWAIAIREKVAQLVPTR